MSVPGKYLGHHVPLVDRKGNNTRNTRAPLLLWILFTILYFTILIRRFLLQGLERFRMDETLCDVVLVPGDSDETFRVHRVIMALSSDYFKAMFTGESGWNAGQRP